MTNEQLQMIGLDEAAFEAATEAERVEWGKANTTAGFGLCDGAIVWLRDRWEIVSWRMGSDSLWCRLCSGVGITIDGYVYRLSPDYQPPVKRWLFDPATKAVDWTHDTNMKHGFLGWIEVTADYAAYLSEKPEGEWDLRIPKEGELTFPWRGTADIAECDFGDMGRLDRGYRWCKPKAVAGWVEYEVLVMDGEYVICYNGGHRLPLYKAENRVGFGGVQFEGLGAWHMATRKLVDTRGVLFNVDLLCDDRVPAVPVRCRFWEEAK